MNANHFADANSTDKQKPFSTESVIDQHQKTSEGSNPAERDSYDKCCDWIDQSWRTAKFNWKWTEFHNKVSVAFSGFGLFVLIIYTTFTALMYCANKKSADAAKSAADTAASELTLTRSRIEGQEQAIVHLVTADLDVRNGAAGITISNSGQTTANQVHAEFSVTRKTLPDMKVIWRSENYTLESSKLAKGSSISRDYPIDGISLDGWAIDPPAPFFWKQTVIISGALNYDNGFGTQVREPFCEAYVRYLLKSGSDQTGRNGWVACDELNDTVNAVYSEWRKQAQQQ